MNWTDYEVGDFLIHKATKTIVKIRIIDTMEDLVAFHILPIDRSILVVSPISLDNAEKYWSKLDNETVKILFGK